MLLLTKIFPSGRMQNTFMD